MDWTLDLDQHSDQDLDLDLELDKSLMVVVACLIIDSLQVLSFENLTMNFELRV